MSTDDPDTDTDDADRVVSRRVSHPTSASASDEAAYRAADPVPAGEPENAGEPSEHPPGGTAERAAAEEHDEDEDPPDRSE